MQLSFIIVTVLYLQVQKYQFTETHTHTGQLLYLAAENHSNLFTNGS